MVMSDIDVITLNNSKKPDNLINQNPAEKGNYALGAVAQTYLRIKTVKK